LFDCHVHSFFSGDSELNPDIACKTAIEKGLSGMAFVDHMDYDFPNTTDAFNIDFDEYFRYMDKVRESKKDMLKVLKGVEIGIQPHVLDVSTNLVNSYDFDFVIGSVHIIGGEDPHDRQFYPGRTRDQAYARYLEEILFMIRNFKGFDVTGHFSYITRYCSYDDRSLRYNNHSDLFDEIFRELISRGKGFEVNTGSFRDKGDGCPVPEYDINILKRYRELGGEIICLGSDAHFSEHIAYKFNYFSEMVLRAGFKYMTYFENRKPVFIPI